MRLNSNITWTDMEAIMERLMAAVDTTKAERTDKGFFTRVAVKGGGIPRHELLAAKSVLLAKYGKDCCKEYIDDSKSTVILQCGNTRVITEQHFRKADSGKDTLMIDTFREDPFATVKD